MTESALSGRRRRLFVALTVLAAAGIAGALFERSRLAPVPQRFPEASDTFLYSIGILGVLTALLAIVAIGFGFHVRAMWRTKRAIARRKAAHASGQARTGAEWDKSRANFSFVAGIVLTAIALPLLWRDAESYVALTESGYVGRSYLSGTVTREPWSSLHHVEFECRGMGRLRRSRDVLPTLSLRFVGGRVVGDVLSMTPYGTAKTDAVARVEAVRAQRNIPLIWKDGGQEKKFRDQNPEIAECVDNLLNQFPVEKRDPLLAMLTGRVRLHVDAIASE